MSNSFFIKNKELDYIYKIDNANNKEVINKKNDFKKIVNLINKKDINENIKEVNIKEVNIKEDKVKYKINYNKLLENFVNNNEKTTFKKVSKEFSITKTTTRKRINKLEAISFITVKNHSTFIIKSTLVWSFAELGNIIISDSIVQTLKYHVQMVVKVADYILIFKN